MKFEYNHDGLGDRWVDVFGTTEEGVAEDAAEECFEDDPDGFVGVDIRIRVLGATEFRTYKVVAHYNQVRLEATRIPQ